MKNRILSEDLYFRNNKNGQLEKLKTCLSHSINSPLSNVIAGCELLLNKLSSVKENDLREIIFIISNSAKELSDNFKQILKDLKK